MKKRWLSLFVEHNTGALARISGLCSGKFYDYDSITIGPTENDTIARMTICCTCTDHKWEQIKKQLDCCIEVIKVEDLTDAIMHTKELMFLKITNCTGQDLTQLDNIAQAPNLQIIEHTATYTLIECVQTAEKNDLLAAKFTKTFPGHVEIVRSGSIAIMTKTQEWQ